MTLYRNQMANPHRVPRLIPAAFRAEDCDLVDALEKVAESQGLPKEEAKEVFDVLPLELRSAPAFKDRFTGLWRYEYGLPYAVASRTRKVHMVAGTDQAPKVSVLFNGIRVLLRQLSRPQFVVVLKRLKDRRKHRDFLAELDPVIRPAEPFRAQYEPSGYGRGGRKIDWHIQFSDGSSCLLDVKHRIKGLLFHMKLAASAAESGEQPRFPAPNPDGLFSNLETKFAKGIEGRFQGVWIVTGIWYDEAELRRQFASLDASKIDFAVLTHFEGEARIFVRNETTKHWLKEKFRLQDMKPPWERAANVGTRV